MNPVSPHFTTVDLSKFFNARRTELPEPMRVPTPLAERTGATAFNGIPFMLGEAEGPAVILLDAEPVTVELEDGLATYIVFLHAVADRVTNYLDGFADFAQDGNELGGHVSSYVFEYEDGSRHETAIRRRFAIQQSRVVWGGSPFETVPAMKATVFNSATEETQLGRVPSTDYGRGETRTSSGRDQMEEKMWLYALENPHPDKPIRRLLLEPRNEGSTIYAISLTNLDEHPLRPGVRRKLRLTLPEGVEFNAIDEYEDLAIDLGYVISARAAFDYDGGRWLGEEANVQPAVSQRDLIIEYSAHPQAWLHVGVDSDEPIVYDLSQLEDGQPGDAIVGVAAAHRLVDVRVVQKGTNNLVPVRIHLHGAHGEYLPPRGRHRKVNPYWFEDNYGEFVNGANQYAYVPGECVADLPLGDVYVEIARGYEVRPLRTRVTVAPDTDELTFELDRVLRWRERGWVTADTHVHFLSPQTALLEGAAEGVNVVNLLASQWGEMFSNVGDFDGATTLGARDFGGSGEFLVRVGTENRMQVLGHISLLGYSGPMIHPLCSGGPSESAIGDPQEVTMADWATRCIEQGGVVVMPHGPNPQCERAADIVLGVVDAMEMMTFNPCEGQLNPYGIADWYRYLNLGYRLPVVGGSDKMAASSQLGGVRTYTQLGEREFTYDNWMAALRAGNTFVTVGPLAGLTVEGRAPGATVELPPGGGTVEVEWRVESVSVPISAVELIHGGVVADEFDAGNSLSASGSAAVRVERSSWLALRVRGSYRSERSLDIAAHTSAVQVRVGGARPFSAHDAGLILDQIEGALAYVDTIAPRPDARRYRQLRATLEGAWNRLHQTMHRHGVFHDHVPLHDHAEHHEH
jgi:hypothetical protein